MISRFQCRDAISITQLRHLVASKLPRSTVWLIIALVPMAHPKTECLYIRINRYNNCESERALAGVVLRVLTFSHPHSCVSMFLVASRPNFRLAILKYLDYFLADKKNQLLGELT